MNVRRLKWIAIAILWLYAAGFAHQLLPHDRDHGNGESCPLCALLTCAGVAVTTVLLARMTLAVRAVSSRFVPPYCRIAWWPCALRAPPPTLLLTLPS